MFKINLKIAWRNLLKYKGYTAVNVFGLSLGLAGFVFVLLFVNHQRSYDTWHPALKNVYQYREYSTFFSPDKKAHWIDGVDFRLSKVANNIPEVIAATRLYPVYRERGVTVNGKSALEAGIRKTDSLFFKVLPYQFRYGNAENAFLKPNSIVLKDRLAKKYFGNINPVGKTLTIAGGSWNGSEEVYTVTGVIQESDTPSAIEFEALSFEGGDFMSVENEHGEPAEVYIRTIPINDFDHLSQNFQREYLKVKANFLKNEGTSLENEIKQGNAPLISLIPLKDVHESPLHTASWTETIKPVGLLAILLLAVSIINFINLTTAQAANRAKEIGVKKVIGAHRKSIILQFLTETLMQCFTAMFIALFLIELSLPTLNGYFDLELSLFHGPSIVKLAMQLIIVVVVIGVTAGFYPALFLSSYRPQAVLKGNYALGKGGNTIKQALLGLQFVVSICFIIGILVINYQLKFLQERDNGFTSTGLINVRADLGSGNAQFFQKMKRIDGVKDVAFISGVIGDNAENTQTFKFGNESRALLSIGMGIEGMRALDARLVDGRFFSENVVQDTIGNVMLNEAAAKLFGKSMVGKTLMANDTTVLSVIGIIKNIQVEGYEQAVKPTLYLVESNTDQRGINYRHKPTTLVRFDPAKAKQVVAAIEGVFADINPFYPVSYSFVRDDVNSVLITHLRFEKMVALFSVLSLMLCLFGLFALAAFTTKQRTKEIAVRKVLGARTADVLVLLNRGYLWIVVAANAVAFPLAFIFTKLWLANFAYRIAITPLPFILALLASVLVTLITVSLQAKKAVNANPVKALKYE